MMRLPLYTAYPEIALDKNNSNAGLWYDKFCNKWPDKSWSLKTDSNGDSTINPKAEWINTVTGEKIGNAEKITEMNLRLAGITESLAGETRIFSTDWRFVTGLGREHPVENGFAWHFILGTPYLPGSSVKGLVRSWANYLPDDDPEDKNEKTKMINCLFGSKTELNGTVGSIVFFDALPIQPVVLEADVMTPHFSEYYNKVSPPADWLKPEPIQFLTVAKGQKFMFSVAPRDPKQLGAKDDVETVMNWLEAALAWYGAGAKTAVGYGRFERDGLAEEKWKAERENIEKEKQRQKELLEMSPIRKEMEQDGYRSTNENVFMKAMTGKWLKSLEADDISTDDRSEIASLLSEWYQKNKPDQWRKPSGKNEKKVNQIKSVFNI